MAVLAVEPGLAQVGIGLLGGLALFLYGMEKLSGALRAAAGDRMRQLLARLTADRFRALASGAVVTAVLQSSSVTTVLVVGFVASGLLTLWQSVGVIIGSNVGTTVTAQVIAFQVTRYALLLVGLGFLAASLSRRDQPREVGNGLFGLGLVFLGMDLMSQATLPLRGYPPFLALMRELASPWWGVAAGAGFTALVHSSAATTGVVLTLTAQGLVSLEGGIALVLGANLGTCVTAVLASIGRPVEALQAALVHVLFNLLGVLAWVGFVPQLAELARGVSPAHPDLGAGARLAAEVPRQLANAHTLFNVINALVMIWLVTPLAWLASKLAPRRRPAEAERAQPRYLDPALLGTPTFALNGVRLELGRLGERVARMVDAASPAVLTGGQGELARLADMDNDVDVLYAAIVQYARQLAREQLTTPQSRELKDCLAAAQYLENAGDLIETNLVALGMSRLAEGVLISKGTIEAVRPLYSAVALSLREALQAFIQRDVDLAHRVVARKRAIRVLHEDALDHIRARLLADDPNRVRTFEIEVDLVSQIQRLDTYARRLARLLVPGPATAAPTPEASATPAPA